MPRIWVREHCVRHVLEQLSVYPSVMRRRRRRTRRPPVTTESFSDIGLVSRTRHRARRVPVGAHPSAPRAPVDRPPTPASVPRRRCDKPRRTDRRCYALSSPVSASASQAATGVQQGVSAQRTRLTHCENGEDQRGDRVGQDTQGGCGPAARATAPRTGPRRAGSPCCRRRRWRFRAPVLRAARTISARHDGQNSRPRGRSPRCCACASPAPSKAESASTDTTAARAKKENATTRSAVCPRSRAGALRQTARPPRRPKAPRRRSPARSRLLRSSPPPRRRTRPPPPRPHCR